MMLTVEIRVKWSRQSHFHNGKWRKVKIRMSISGIPLLIHLWYLLQGMCEHHYLPWRPTEDLKTVNFSMFLTVLVIEKKVNNVTQTLSVAAIIEYDMEAIWDFDTFIEKQAPCNEFTKISQNQKHIFRGKYCKSVIIRSQVKEMHICGLSPFFTAETVKMALGGSCHPKVSLLILMF